jgi:hypothetical protein
MRSRHPGARSLSTRCCHLLILHARPIVHCIHIPLYCMHVPTDAAHTLPYLRCMRTSPNVHTSPVCCLRAPTLLMLHTFLDQDKLITPPDVYRTSFSQHHKAILSVRITLRSFRIGTIQDFVIGEEPVSAGKYSHPPVRPAEISNPTYPTNSCQLRRQYQFHKIYEHFQLYQSYFKSCRIKSTSLTFCRP